MKKKNIIIFGAGLLGLRIGDLLSQKGYHVELVEASYAPGGMMGTFKRDFEGRDYYFDYGPHLLFHNFKDDYRDLIGDDLLDISSSFSMLVKGKRLAYPLKIKEMLMNLPFRDVVLTGMEVIYNQIAKRNVHSDSLEEWITKRFGKIPFQQFYAPYIQKCNGLPPNDVAVDWVTERTHVTGNSLLGTAYKRIKTALSKKDTAPNNLPSSDRITAYYPRKGAGEITDALAKRIQDKGGIIHINSRVNKVIVTDNHLVNWISVKHGKQEVKLYADYYISTIPLPVLIKNITPAVSISYLEAANCLKYRQLILMYLIIDQPRVLDCIEVFFADKEVIFKRIYEPKSLSDYMAPPHRTSLCLEICCNETDDFSEEEVYQKAIDNLRQTGVVTPDKISHYFTIRVPYAYPIYCQGFKEKVNLLLDYIKSINNLTTIGRQGLFKYHAMTNETMEMAVQLANSFVD